MALQIFGAAAGAGGGGGGTGSGLPSTVVTKTAAYTAAVGEFVQANTTTAGFTVTLPTAPATGALVAIKKVSGDTNTLTIAAAGGGTIDGTATATTVTQWAGVVLEHTGSNVWRVAASMSTTGPAGTNGTNGAISSVQDEGSAMAVRSKLNFVGTSVTLTDDSVNDRTNVTITGGSGGATSFLPHAVVSGRYITTPGTTSGALVMSSGYEYAFPFEVPASTTITAMGLNVSTAVPSAVLRLGIRADAAGQPGAVLLDAGSDIDASTTGNKEVAVSFTFAPGTVYWITARSTGANATVAQTLGMPVQISGPTQASIMQNAPCGFNNQGGGSGPISGAFGTTSAAVTVPRIAVKVA